MRLRAAAFSARGEAWAEKLKCIVERPQNVMDWTAEAFSRCDALLFIGAAGIAVRAIAPHIRSKMTDPAVVVMDECGKHVIPILSGHVGGANALALAIAQKTGAQAAVTTATDLHHLPAIDTWAVTHDCAIENPRAIKAVSARVLQGLPVGVMITERTLTPPFPVTLVLRPRTLTLGAGCKRGVSPGAFEQAVMTFFSRCGVSLLSLRALASIDRKADEKALCDFSAKYAVPFQTYTAEQLNAVPGVFAESAYVRKTVGVGNVCERAAVACGGGRLLTGKTVFDGITLALAGEETV